MSTLLLGSSPPKIKGIKPLITVGEKGDRADFIVNFDRFYFKPCYLFDTVIYTRDDLNNVQLMSIVNVLKKDGTVYIKAPTTREKLLKFMEKWKRVRFQLNKIFETGDGVYYEFSAEKK